METIRVYLDNMFLNIPDSEQVRRVKSELYDMMEDKYRELIGEGKPENEAIGIVISEFGNLEELKEELGLSSQDNWSFSETDEKEEKTKKEKKREEKKKDSKKDSKKKSQNKGEPVERLVSFEEVEDYIQDMGKISTGIGVGTMLLIWSPGAIVVLANRGNLGVALGLALMFVFAAAGVGAVILAAMKGERYEYLKKEVLRLDVGVEQFVREEKEAFHQAFVLQIAVGVILCILSPVQVMIYGILDLSDNLILFSVGMLLVMVGIGSLLLVRAGMQRNVYNVLLQEQEYQKEKKAGFLKVFDSLYWLVVTAIYLSWSFQSGSWAISWIIWVIAGVFYTPVENKLRGK